jgi:hypothetical protein
MARRAISSIVADFDSVSLFLQERAIIAPRPTADVLQIAKSIHAATFSLILWRFRLKKLAPHARVFIEEIASDALQILPQVLMGYGKTAKLLTRGILENALRHVYFSDHPIEFLRMNREAKWYMSVEQLCDYAKNHPSFMLTETKFDALAQVTSLYSKLSAGVHGRTVSDLEMRVALQKITYDQSSAEDAADSVLKCAQAINFLLAIFQRQQMRAFQIEDQRIILRTMPMVARRVWTEHDPNA